jgi:DNA-binding NarL/FixJ family response regulator
VLEDNGFEVTARVGDGRELLRAVAADVPQLALVDIRMPPNFDDEGIQAAHELDERFPDVGVLVLSQYVEPEFAMELLEERTRGRGYLLKDKVTDVKTLVASVWAVGTGGSFVDPAVVSQLVTRRGAGESLSELTARERETLALMAEGRSNAAICSALFLSPKTVETHVHSIFMKLNLQPAEDDHRRVLAVLRYLRAAGA